MDAKNNIKIDSFEVTRMYLGDIPEVLKLAISNQNSFGIHPSASPSAFLNEMSKVLQKNTRLSFVLRKNNQIFAAFIVEPLTSKSANFLYSLYDNKSVSLSDLIPYALKKLDEMNIDYLYAFALKSNKKAEAYQDFLKILGFKYIFNENDVYLVFSNKKA